MRYAGAMLATLIELDEKLFSFLHGWASFAPGFWKAIAIYGIYLIPFVLVWYWFARRRETALLAALAGILAWQGIAALVGLVWDRERPTPFIDLNFPEKEVFFERPGPSFPSDHTAFLTALTLIFWVSGERRLAVGLGILTLITMLSRVVTAQHWPLDLVGGLVTGLITVGLVVWLRRPIERYVIQPLVGFARKIGL